MPLLHIAAILEPHNDEHMQYNGFTFMSLYLPTIREQYNFIGTELSYDVSVLSSAKLIAFSRLATGHAVCISLQTKLFAEFYLTPQGYNNQTWKYNAAV